MNNDILHPASDRLEAFVEGSLGDGDRAVLASHLNACARCQTEADELRALFAALDSLPRLDATPGFADRIMAGVRVHQPWQVRFASMLQSLLPTGPTGWILVTAFLVLPVATVGGAIAWLFSRPGLTPTGLWIFVRDRVQDAALDRSHQLLGTALENGTAVQLWEQIQTLHSSIGLTGIGAGAALFGAITVGAAWILYENLFRTPTREDPYAPFHA